MFITALFIIARTWKQPRCPSADEWIRKLWYIYTMEYYSAIKKNTFESVLMRWMKLEPIIQNEVSQKEKHQYSILTHIYVSMPFSQIIPPSPSPSESKSPLYTSVSLLLSYIQGRHFDLSKFHICVSILYWCFSFWLTSLCIIGSSFIHLIRTDSNEFFLTAE